MMTPLHSTVKETVDQETTLLIVTCNECSYHFEEPLSTFGSSDQVFCTQCGSRNCDYVQV